MTVQDRALPFRRVVVPVGGTDREFLAQEHAVGLAARLEVPLFAAHVRPDPDQVPADMFSYLEKQCEHWGVELTTHVAGGTDPNDFMDDELDALDLVVIGTRRLGTKWHVSSFAEHLARHAPCPVQMVRLDA